MANRLVSVDSGTLQFPDDVRAKQAANLADPSTPEGSQLNDTIVAAVGYKPTGVQRLVGMLQQQRGNIVVAMLGDSTADEAPEWPTRAFSRAAAVRPWLKWQYYHWTEPQSAGPWTDPTSGSYDPVTVMQAGVAPTIGGRAWYDTFAGTAGELVSTPSTPQQSASTWGGATGLWARTGAGKINAVTAGSGISQTLTFTGSHRRLSATVSMDQVSTGKNIDLWLGANATNRVLFYLRNNAGTWQWQLAKTIGGTFTTIAAYANIPGVATDGSVTSVSFVFDINDTAVSVTINGQSLTATLLSGDVTALNGGCRVGIDSSGTVTSGTGTQVANLTLDLIAAREVPSLTLYNGSKTGSTLSYQRDRLPRIIPVAPDVVLIGSSHNYTGISAADYLTDVQATIDAVYALYPDTYVVLSSQNPELPPHSQTEMDTHRDRCLALPPFAANNGFGYVAAFEAFTADGPGPQRIRADGTHPTGNNAAYDNAPDPTNGSYLWSSAFLDYLAQQGMTPVA